MGHEVRRLKQPALLHGRKVRNVSEVVDGSPLSASLMKSPDPDLGTGVEAPLRKDNQPALSVVVFVKVALQRYVETTADLLRGLFDRVFSIEGIALLDRGSIENPPTIGRCKDDVRNVS